MVAVCVAGLVALFAMLRGGPVDAQSRRGLEREQAEIRAKRRGVEKRLKELKVAANSAAGKLYLAQDRLALAEEQYLRAKKRLEDTQKTLKKVKDDLAGTEARFGKHQQAFSGRVVALYERGQGSFVETVLQARSFAELTERADRCGAVLGEDQFTLYKIKLHKQSLDEARVKCERQMQEEQQARTEAQQVYDRVKTQRAAAHKELASLKADRARWEDTYKELERASNEITAHLRSLATSGSRGSTYSGTWSGSFLRPVSGRITSPYGYRKDPFTGSRRMHTGVDLKAARGGGIKAAAAGQVIHTGWWGAYGKCMIVDHGKSRSGARYTTLYAHLLSYKVSPGTIVKRGQVIGLADSTGRSTGHHLHFEVRENGRPINPLTAGM